MKKVILTTAAALLLGMVGASFAQTAVDATKGNGLSGSVKHLVLIHVPNVMMLRVKGSTGTDVIFKPTVAQAGAAYVGGTLLTPDSTSTFVEVDAFTNMSNGGPSISVGVADTVVGANPSNLTSDILLGSGTTPPAANTVSTSLTTNGWTPLWTLGDFKLSLPSTAIAGDYSYTVTYTISNP